MPHQVRDLSEYRRHRFFEEPYHLLTRCEEGNDLKGVDNDRVEYGADRVYPQRILCRENTCRYFAASSR